MSTIITKVDAFLLQVPFTGILRTGIDTASPSDMAILLVRLTTDGGLTGWGEAFGHGCCRATKEAIESLVGQALIGADAGDIAGLSLRLQQRFHLFGRTGPVRYALAGIDIALWDLAGKFAGLPLYRLLGGQPREAVPAYASLERYGARETLVAACERAVAEGYRAIKLHEIDIGLIEAARQAVGPGYMLMADTNCPWTAEEAFDKARTITGCNLRWLEEPVWPPEDHASIATVRRIGTKTAAGENMVSLMEFRNFFEADALDVAQPSVAKIGLTETLKVIALAEAFGVTVAPHCAYFGSGYLAALHLVAAMPGDILFERLFLDFPASPFAPFTTAIDGTIAVPQSPGLGCEPAAEWIQHG
ncbi:mandelate racemase/muconate lactonizing enzyme family protein [Acidisoma silvae]|uniref:Mandelate racemase/muconate lactonizing enzyme family protein n=1 Tax=Acidisoma silvae TaxID=2802396 RepID=A0A963YWB0_9PROT|nr:mandelate racemase/muconate lactonizing enzyme family protein [Acidisoma silvae]MCB8878034.1 mandelate racemase/muconate lactonizing enzyme family protein [Acidisoma silvae]